MLIVVLYVFIVCVSIGCLSLSCHREWGDWLTNWLNIKLQFVPMLYVSLCFIVCVYTSARREYCPMHNLTMSICEEFV